jgi:hypothetical protein
LEFGTILLTVITRVCSINCAIVNYLAGIICSVFLIRPGWTKLSMVSQDISL